MAPKKQKNNKVQFEKDGNISEPCDQLDVGQSTPVSETQNTEASQATQATLTSTETTKQRYGAARGPAAMYKVVVKKAKGKKFRVTYNELGVPVGSTRHTLQSYIGMLARTMIPIDIDSWTNVDPELKGKLWLDIQTTFKVAPESEKMVLKSAGAKWRQFKSHLTGTYVMPHIGQKNKLRKPPKNYEFVGKDKWKKFVAQRTSDKWMSIRESQSQRVKSRKYPHRLSRKGYVGLREEEMKKGNFELGEVPDRAILWKKARVPKAGMIDEELAGINGRIDSLLEKKRKGEFKSSGSQDVLTTALQSPEHSGRVRGVGSFVTPKVFFDLPKEKRTRISKAELLARDKQRSEELERTKQEMMSEIASLKELISSSKLSSPVFSDKASCEQKIFKHDAGMVKPSVAKELMVDDGYVEIIPTPPADIKGPLPCELSVDNIDNKVAFGLVFEDANMNQCIHEVPMKPGCVRVSVDGSIQGDALVPVPIPGEIEKVSQAVGSQLAWPKNLITVTSGMKQKSSVFSEKKSEKIVLRKMQTKFANVKTTEKMPKRFKLLYKYATTYMKDSGSSIPIPCDAEVFGLEKVIYILHENIIALLDFDQIGQSAICAYMNYLHNVIRENDDLELFAFIDPAATFNINKEFERYVVNRLKEGNPDRMFLMPHNQSEHWILVILWEGDIYILNPLPSATHFIALEKALSSAIKSFNAETGRAKRTPEVKKLIGSPKQPGGRECGYVVMRYMKDIIEDKGMSLIYKWATKNRMCYSMDDLDLVRGQTLEHIEDKI